MLFVATLVVTGLLADWTTGLRVALAIFFAWALGILLIPTSPQD